MILNWEFTENVKYVRNEMQTASSWYAVCMYNCEYIMYLHTTLGMPYLQEEKVVLHVCEGNQYWCCAMFVFVSEVTARLG